MWKRVALHYIICWIISSYYKLQVRCFAPFDCDFETGFCNWTQSSDDELDWRRISGAKLTDNSIPVGDHTTGDGFYAYIDTSSDNVGNEYRAWLISPSMTNGTYCFSFWYYVYGKHVYTLKVFKSFNGWTHLLQILGSQGKRWILTSIDISSTSRLKIIIFGRFNNVDSTNYSIIAIDDISMFRGSCPTECEDPTPTFGYVDLIDFKPGSVANIACTRGYTLRGKSPITCLANGTWSGKPECFAIDCLVPSFANGRIVNISEGTTFNSSLQLACDIGYRLEGTTYVTCQADGNWSQLPTCQIIKCDDPTPAFGSVDSTDFTTSSVANIACTSGYTLRGRSSITCLANGTWSGKPECFPIDCGDPTPMSGNVSSTNFQFKSEIEITCNPGYTIVGNSSTVCQDNGDWSNNPVCKPIESSSVALLYIVGPVVVVILAIIILIILLCIVFDKNLAKNICFWNNTGKETNCNEDTRHDDDAENRSEKNMFTANCNGLETLTTEKEYENDHNSKLETTASEYL